MDKKVLVTGGAGTLGRAVVKRLLKDGSFEKVVVFSRDEASQAAMATEADFKTARVAFEIGDVTSRDSIFHAMARHGVTHAVHAAALKHVPVCEKHPSDCVETNIVGSRNVLRAAVDLGLSGVVLVSTDKAAQPTNTYGLSKALMERLVPEFDGVRGLRVNATRFGNLVGSRGSVLELFLRQIRTEGKVTVTDPDMTRFFIRVVQAADTVAFALDCRKGGLVFVPQMKAAKLSEFVRATIEFSRAPAEMFVVGLRPGEKRHEMVITAEEAGRTILIPEYFGVAIGQQQVAKPALKAPLSSDLSPMMSADELLGMIAEVGRETAQR